MTTILDPSNLDFADVKDSLKTYLSNQTEFLDFDFEGSGISVLLDILAYNTVYNAYYMNMVGNEMFLDSSIVRDSVVSHAKMLGYFPRSKRSATATIDLEIIPEDSPANILIPKGTLFSTTIDGTAYTFSTKEATLVYPVDGDYIAEDLEIVEGDLFTHTFTVDADYPEQRFILPNAGVDTSLLTVGIQNSISDLSYYVFRLADDYTEIDDESMVYFVQEVQDLKHEIYFGDGVVGYAPVAGNLIIVDYLISHGTAANGASVFTLASDISGYTSCTITTVESASGGAEEEEITSIKYLAPLNYITQNRAVTKSDYESLILRDFPNVDSVRVWGGEDNDPPIYGKVYVSIKPISGLVLSLTTKQNLVDSILRKRNMVSVEVEVVDPDYVYLVVDSIVKYKSSLCQLSASALQQAVIDTIYNYGQSDLDRFETYFRYSRFINLIDETDDSIQNNLTSIKLMYKLYPSFTVPTQYTIEFNNEIDAAFSSTGLPTLSSTSFVYNGQTCYFDDDGAGIVRIYRLANGVRNVVEGAAGSIDYTTGIISINSFMPSSIVSGDEYIELSVNPVSNDVTSLRNQLLVIETANISVTLVDEDL